ncbi:transcription factor TFIIIB subunit brf1, partial [Tieghemiomyces parasiticus]
MGCKNCGSNAIEYDSAAGNAFCVSCGAVTEENTIVSEVTFGESSNGAAILQGAMVSNDTGRLNLSGHYGKHNAVQSREKTLSNGKRAIFSLGTALRLSDRFKEAAHRYYTLAVNCNFNKGRPTQNVAAACLYIVCRQEKSGQMLMDFSDILQTNVFLLGVTFVRLVRQLNLILPMVDPSLYMARFAMRLEFGDKTQRVTMDALRLAQRMDRDWLLTGRRPAGVCGACLLIAARMHNFHRTYDEMIRVVKVASVTIQERLREFKRTPTSALSMADFRNVWLEESCDPPAFTRNRQAHLKVHHHAHHLYREEMGDAPPHESAEPVERSAKRRALEGGLRGDGDEDGATNDAREDHRDGEYRLPSAKVKAD